MLLIIMLILFWFVIAKCYLSLESMIERLLMMLQDMDFWVRLFLARRIGVLFQTWTGHEELFLDIWFVAVKILYMWKTFLLSFLWSHLFYWFFCVPVFFNWEFGAPWYIKTSMLVGETEFSSLVLLILIHSLSYTQ